MVTHNVCCVGTKNACDKGARLLAELKQARAALAAIREVLRELISWTPATLRIHRILEQTGLPPREPSGAEPERARLLRVEKAAREFLSAWNGDGMRESDAAQALLDALDGGGEKT